MVSFNSFQSLIFVVVGINIPILNCVSSIYCNTLNIISVYGATGNPDDDGYLNDPGAQNGITSLTATESQRFIYILKERGIIWPYIIKYSITWYCIILNFNILYYGIL